ncbi:Arc family DNA-binding protein [Veronia nyctiphanis]|nr:Arc family DNA-binding protein [Veronia nyctiphanis]
MVPCQYHFCYISPMTQKLQFKLRLDEELHDLIKSAADASNQSINTEVTKRLQNSFTAGRIENADYIDAREAREISSQALADGYSVLMLKCMKLIGDAARQGNTEVLVDTGYSEISPSIETDIIQPVKDKLESLGYQTELDGSTMKVGF